MEHKKSNQAFHIMTKPIGSKCNLDCKYCFYLEKESLWGRGERFRMNLATLEAYVKAYIQAQPYQTITFAWQGGEPTLMGKEFYEHALKFQKKYAKGKQIENTIQTNGTLLDDDWGSFFHDHKFLVGLSVDGPEYLHDAYRVGKNGKGSWKDVMKGVEILRRHNVEWNSLTCVHRANSKQPLEVYQFLKDIGSRFMQFIPIVERKANDRAKQWGLSHASPPNSEHNKGNENEPSITPWSVAPAVYGDFLNAIFDDWVRHDVGRIFVQLHDVTLGKWLNIKGGLCIFEETCGNAMALEHDGSLFSCDHYVYPSHRLGNVLDTDLAELLESTFQKKFGSNKRDKLPTQCLECPVKRFCNGGCPKHRFTNDIHGNPGLNYLCEGYYRFFTHSAPLMQKMAGLYSSGRPPADIMRDKVKNMK